MLTIAVVVVLASPGLSCDLPGGDSCAPPDEAAAIVPAAALAYVHVNLDGETDQYRRASEIAAAVPLFSGELIDRAVRVLSGGRARAEEFESEIRPWSAGELAFALLEADREVVLIEVADAQGAGDYADGLRPLGLGVAEPKVEEHDGVEISVDANGLATAQVEGFLALGPAEAVRAVIETASGADGAQSLADDETAVEVREQLPDQRLLEAYVSEDGVAELIAGSRETLASFSPLVSPVASRGIGASVGFGEQDEVELALRSVLNAERVETSPGFFAAFPAFEPTLPARLSSEAFAYAGIGDPGETVAALLEQAGTQAPGVAAGFDDLSRRLQRQSDVDIEGELLDGLGDEGAFSLEPRPEAGDSEPVPAAAPGALPYAGFVADGVDEPSVRKALASLQDPLAAAVGPGQNLQAPAFEERELAGVDARSLRLSPSIELTYAVFDGIAAIASDPAAIEQLAEGSGGLDSAERFERATDAFEDEVSLLAYLDLERLVALGEGLGLAEDPTYATFAGEFRRLDALGLAVVADSQTLASDARLLFGEAEEPETDAPPVVPGD